MNPATPSKAIQNAVVLAAMGSTIAYYTNKINSMNLRTIVTYLIIYTTAILYVDILLPRYSWEILHSSIVYFSFILHNHVKSFV